LDHAPAFPHNTIYCKDLLDIAKHRDGAAVPVSVSVGPSGSGPASRSTAAKVWAGARCEYLTVIAMLLCPRSSWIVRKSTPPLPACWQMYGGGNARRSLESLPRGGKAQTNNADPTAASL